jgi:hypothetical protein
MVSEEKAMQLGLEFWTDRQKDGRRRCYNDVSLWRQASNNMHTSSRAWTSEKQKRLNPSFPLD